MKDYKQLRALCDAATDGDWSPSRADIQSYDIEGNPFANIYANTKTINLGMHPSGLKEPKELPLPVTLAKCIEQHPSVDCKANAAFIAAANPQTVRALIDEVGRLRDAIIMAREQMQEFANFRMEQGYINPWIVTLKNADDACEQALKGTDDGTN